LLQQQQEKETQEKRQKEIKEERTQTQTFSLAGTFFPGQCYTQYKNIKYLTEPFQ